MKIKARPDDILDSNELFQMNGWLAELRDEGRAESPDEERSGAGGNGYAKPRDDGRAQPRPGSRAESRPGGRHGSRQDSRTDARDGGRSGSWQDGYPRSPKNGRARLEDHSQAGSRRDTHTGSRDEGQNRPWDDGHAGPGKDGRAWPRGDSQANPRRGYPRPGVLAAARVSTPVTRTQATMRAVIGDELRLPVMWCEMSSCISWFAHPAALGEADIRARAIDAGWRVDAVGMLACPLCVQTAPGFQSPLPVAPWDGEEAIVISGQMADEPSAEAVAGVARELSHDLRCPASDHRDEVRAASAWIAAVPADDVARGANGETNDEVRHPAEGYQPANRPRPGRHRKRLAARFTFAGH